MQRLETTTNGKGLYLITNEVERLLPRGQGLCHLQLLHTSCSLLIQENADPSARADLAQFLERLVPENQSWHTHTDEGPDDTTSHMRAALLPSSLLIPFADGRLILGTWQGVYVVEHRRAPHLRRLHLSFVPTI